MIALNNNSIFVGQIKQLLHDFNLPLCKIGDRNLSSNSYYILNDMIYYRYTENETIINKPCYEYVYNEPYLNITDNFKIDNMLYDRATHEYLGTYLRFLRDYKDINLMSMYNYFDGNTLEQDISFDIGDITINFRSENIDCVIYKIPVSFVNEYSISLHNTKTIELCLYDEADSIKPNTDATKYDLCKKTYKKTQVNNVFYYEIGDIGTTTVSNNLYMLIKVPKDLTTSVTILEGKYYSTYENLNILPIGDEVNLNVASQLLSTENTYGNNLLGDRLLEYLTGSVICKLSEPYDIKRLQLTLDSMYSTSDPEKQNNPNVPKVVGRLYGIWDSRDQEIIEYVAIKNDLIRYDSLGYADKDVENYLIANYDFDTVEFNISRNGDGSISI